MVENPSRSGQGGDVEGSVKTDVLCGAPISIARASIDPGYDVFNMDTLNCTEADLLQGFTSHGKATGDGVR